ncbi:MAG TPA: peptidase M1, partial [Bacteroidia bacterium]
MNSIKFIFSLGLGSLLLSLHAQQTYFDGSFQKIVEAEKKAYTKKINPKPSASISNYDVKYHRCEWNVDPAVNFIQGKVTTYFKPLTANFDSVLFNLSDTMKVDSVVYHAHGVLFSHSGNIIRSVLPSIIPLNALDSISVFYHGAPDSTGFGSFVQGTHSGTPIIWTLSQPYGASDWWPCKNSLTDKADSIDVIVTAPSAYRAASNGLLVA